MTLYVVEVKENTLVIHDGEIQLGVFFMSMEKFLQSAELDYTETYWLPDTFSKRYKRINYQKHLKKASIGTKNDI